MTEPNEPNEPNETAALIEAAAGAWRPRGNGGETRAHPAFYDLDEKGRQEAFETALANRVLEASLDPNGLSSTVKAVLARLPR